MRFPGLAGEGEAEILDGKHGDFALRSLLCQRKQLTFFYLAVLNRTVNRGGGQQLALGVVDARLPFVAKGQQLAAGVNAGW